MTRWAWLHEDALRLTHPACQESDRQAFVWDDAYLEAQGYSFKRLVFIYETLVEMGVEIYRGDTESVLLELVAENDQLAIPDTPNPELKRIVAALSQQREVDIVADEPFAIIQKEPEYKRFFRYWNKAKQFAMQIDGGVDA